MSMRRSRPTSAFVQRLPLWLALSVTLLLGGCGTTVFNPVTGQAERSAMSEAQEVQTGRQAHAEVLKETPRLANEPLQAYVQALGKKLAAQSHRPELDWHFTVLDSAEVNAFALPGGYVYVTRGILAHLNSEAELAGVLGHEIGHVTARHGAQRATRQQDAGLGVLAATVLGAVLEARGVGGATEMLGQTAQGVAAGHVANYSREQELQADALGAEYLAKSRYDAVHMVDVIQVLKDQERYAADQARAQGQTPPPAPGWLSSHPSNDERLARIHTEAALRRLPPDEARKADDGQQRFLQATQGLIYGDSAEQGLVRGRHFIHPELKLALTAPQGWHIVNGAEQLQIVAPDRQAALILQAVPPQAGRQHDDILRRWVRAEQGRSQALQFNGLAATRFSGMRRDAQGQLSPVALTLVSSPTGAVYALARSGRAAQGPWRAALDDAEQSLRPPSAVDLDLAKPWRLALRRHPSGGFAELARSAPQGVTPELLRLINGRYGHTDPQAEPKPGEWVKTLQALQ
ncbi:M48 family metalloprotease [Roseateles sp. BYS180W]|uniref:M48 family metalloprotease n=1 Tax=Roseateles rivi TaxID=3299028 RepID=A0ABW7FR84_9BURK